MQTDHTIDPGVHAVAERLKLENQFRNGANWFFWIAGMSLINSLVGLFGGTWGFVIGLGLTQLIDAMLTTGDGELGPRLFGTVLTAAVAGLFLAFGHFAREGRRAAFIAGMSLYVVDTVIFVVVQDLLAVGLHAFALFCLFKGLQAKQQLDRLPAPRPTPVGVASN